MMACMHARWDVPVRWSRNLPAEPTSVAVIEDTAGRYFASFVVQTGQDERLSTVESEVGIDLRLTHFAVLSDGTRVTAPRFLRRAARKLKRLQQDLSRKAKGSNRRTKAVVKFARVDRFFPSTRRCSDCGRINDKMTLNVRTWVCQCGSTHDRDVNAARNIKAAGQADFNDRGVQIRPGLVPAPRGEAVTHPDAACSTRSAEGIFVL
jgi:transposase